ncbi:hypothetical protein AVEN_217667-1 [Araneus ventricosus]|uniref:Uncharacterized protein n=1 Tax=Araneus ventricosus TaxID=182803 RepID=A0A4Y2QVI0_ARAVE|nr:hypothetical protein AVEN_217667-1 [Araneus ventricosus]
MRGVKRNVLNVKQKLEILQELDSGESASTDAEDVLKEENTISYSAALQSVETLLDYMGQKGFDYDDIIAVCKICVDIRQEMNKQQKQRRITDFLKQSSIYRAGTGPSVIVIEPPEGTQKEEYEEWMSIAEDIPVAATLSGGLARLPACPMASGPLKQKTIWAPQKVWQRSKEELLL